MKTMLLRLQQEREENNTTYYQSLAQKNKKIVAYYTKEKWLQNFQKLIGPNKGKKIVLVSDFITKIGGIETYLHDVKILLKKQGYEVKLF